MAGKVRKPWKLVDGDIFLPRSIALKLINNRLESERVEEGRAHQNSSTVLPPGGISNFRRILKTQSDNYHYNIRLI